MIRVASLSGWNWPAFRPSLQQTVLALIICGLGLLMAWLPLEVTALLLASVMFFILALIHPVLTLYVLIIVIPFSSLLAVSVSGFRAGVMEIILALGITAALLKLMVTQSLTGQPIKLKGGPFLGLLALFLAGLSFSWLNTFSLSGSF